MKRRCSLQSEIKSAVYFETRVNKIFKFELQCLSQYDQHWRTKLVQPSISNSSWVILIFRIALRTAKLRSGRKSELLSIFDAKNLLIGSIIFATLKKNKYVSVGVVVLELESHPDHNKGLDHAPCAWSKTHPIDH